MKNKCKSHTLQQAHVKIDTAVKTISDAILKQKIPHSVWLRNLVIDKYMVLRLFKISIGKWHH